MIPPTVGRRVWFYPLGLSQQQFPTFGGPHDAGIAYINTVGHTINISVADHLGEMHAFVAVPLLQDGQEEPAEPYCTWMPYQLGQAKVQS
jgi:hypothetical protein